MSTSTSTFKPSGLNAHLFRPPESPAFSNASPSFTSSASSAPQMDYFSAQKSRKRQRPDSSHGVGDGGQATPWSSGTYTFTGSEVRRAETPAWVQCPTPNDAMYGSACAQGSGMVNEQYALRGGFDTPGIMTTVQHDGVMGDRGNWDCGRRGRGVDERRTVGGAEAISGPLARERNGVARMPESPNGSPHAVEATGAGWTGFAFGLVGKMFSFGTSVIKGFYAGGGQGYEFGQHLRSSPPTSWMRSQRYAGGGTPVPGSWQDERDFMGDFEQDNPSNSNTPTSVSRPPNKRRQTDKDTWVMVGTPDTENVETTPKRKVSSAQVPRSSLAGRPSASRANSRRSLAPVSRRSSSYVANSGSPAVHQKVVTHDLTQLNRRASFAPTRSPHSRPSSAGKNAANGGGAVTGAGLSPEVEKYVKRQARQEKATDRTMTSMNRQLKDLISQAQAALGTKYDVENDGDGGGVGSVGGSGGWEEDEGFVDEEW